MCANVSNAEDDLVFNDYNLALGDVAGHIWLEKQGHALGNRQN